MRVPDVRQTNTRARRHRGDIAQFLHPGLYRVFRAARFVCVVCIIVAQERVLLPASHVLVVATAAREDVMLPCARTSDGAAP